MESNALGDQSMPPHREGLENLEELRAENGHREGVRVRRHGISSGITQTTSDGGGLGPKRQSHLYSLVLEFVS